MTDSRRPAKSADRDCPLRAETRHAERDEPDDRRPRLEPRRPPGGRSSPSTALMSRCSRSCSRWSWAAILIAVTDEECRRPAGTSSPGPATCSPRSGTSVSGAYAALFQGSIYNFRRATLRSTAIKPLTETLTFATPLIVAGLGVGARLPRRAVQHRRPRPDALRRHLRPAGSASRFDLPFGLHLLLALVAGVVGGALWGGIAGLLKARTGAHEVITTIMLNYIAFYLVLYLLRTPGLLQAPGSTNPKTLAHERDRGAARLCSGRSFNLHLGFILAIGATILVWWLLNRSSLGFQFRAVGLNPQAARVAGINVKRMYVYVMLISGALAGLAGVFQVLGTVTTGFTHRHRRRASASTPSPSPCSAGPRPWGIVRRGHPVRRVQGRRLRDAGRRGRPDRHRARRPVADRAVHRRPAAGPGRVPAAGAESGRPVEDREGQGSEGGGDASDRRHLGAGGARRAHQPGHRGRAQLEGARSRSASSPCSASSCSASSDGRRQHASGCPPPATSSSSPVLELPTRATGSSSPASCSLLAAYSAFLGRAGAQGAAVADHPLRHRSSSSPSSPGRAAGSTIPVTGLLIGARLAQRPADLRGAQRRDLRTHRRRSTSPSRASSSPARSSRRSSASSPGSPCSASSRAMVAGVLVVASCSPSFAIKYVVDQIIVGVVLNVLVAGLTSFLYSTVMHREPGAEQPAAVRADRHPDPRRDPDPRPGAVPADHHRLHHVRHRRRGRRRAVPHPLGPADPRRWASTRRPRTPSASRSTRCGSGTCRWPGRSPASAGRTSRSARSAPSARK